MFYEPGKTAHGLPHDPFKACVVPRAIRWISTTNPDGATHNIAPYSQFNNLTFVPPYVMFNTDRTSTNKRKRYRRERRTDGQILLESWDLETAGTAKYNC